MGLDQIRLSHGSGLGQERLLQEILPILYGMDSPALEDAAVLPCLGGRIAFTTDSFVVQPLEFRGGNIGKLAACGTINDLAMMGAIPMWISLGLILEEGLDGALLKRVLESFRLICQGSGVQIACGDTKVVERGHADAMFLQSSGIGIVPEGTILSASRARPGDSVLVSGPIGLHGIAVLSARKGLGFASEAVSDCAPLDGLVQTLLRNVPGTRVLRDATRGGCAAVLNEIAQASGVTLLIRETDIPIPQVVRSACSYLGLDPLQVANEGRFIAVVPRDEADRSLAALRSHELGQGSALIGKAIDRTDFPVLLETSLSGTRVVALPPGELLPRIC